MHFGEAKRALPRVYSEWHGWQKLTTQQVVHFASEERGSVFFISSLLQRQFASPFASLVGEAVGHAQ